MLVGGLAIYGFAAPTVIRRVTLSDWGVNDNLLWWIGFVIAFAFFRLRVSRLGHAVDGAPLATTRLAADPATGAVAGVIGPLSHRRGFCLARLTRQH